MGERYQSGMMEGGDEHPCGDTDRFSSVVILHPAAIGELAVGLRKNYDQVGGCFQKRLVLVGS